MKAIRTIVFLVVGGAALSTAVGFTGVSMAQNDDDYIIINRMTTLKERREFFLSLTAERKSALWRKHYTTELNKHPDLTSAQREVVNLAIVIASPDLFAGKVPNVAAPGSVFDSAVKNTFKDAPKLRDEIFGQPAQPLPSPAPQEKQQKD